MNEEMSCFVSGHSFSRAATAVKRVGLLSPAPTTIFVHRKRILQEKIFKQFVQIESQLRAK
jgi:hypothetical protein